MPLKALQFWLNLPKAIKNVERKSRFDVLHFNGYSYGFFKKKLSNAANVITIHHLTQDAIRSTNASFIFRVLNYSSELNSINPIIEKRCVKLADKIISVSNFTREQIVKTYHIPPGKIEVIHLGNELSGDSFTKKEIDEIKHKLNLSASAILLFVGRVNDKRKGLGTLLRAFREVLETIESTLLVVGDGDQTEAKKLSKALGISENIVFTGYADDLTLKKFYSLCDIYVCPSKLEGFGLTILEAMAAGKPIVATDVGALPEIVKNGENGILVASDDPDEMAKAVITYLSDKNLSENVGMRNAKYVKETFSWEISAKKTEQVYKNCEVLNNVNHD